MLMLGNQTIPVKIPPDLNNGEYLEALEVLNCLKRLQIIPQNCLIAIRMLKCYLGLKALLSGIGLLIKE